MNGVWFTRESRKSLTWWFPSGWSEWILHHKHITAFILPSLKYLSWVFKSLTAGHTSTQWQQLAHHSPGVFLEDQLVHESQEASRHTTFVSKSQIVSPAEI